MGGGEEWDGDGSDEESCLEVDEEACDDDFDLADFLLFLLWEELFFDEEDLSEDGEVLIL